MQDRYGSPDLLRLVDVPTPRPGEGEVLVRVRAASVHPDVWHTVTGVPYVLRLMGSGLRRPRNPIPGTDLAGVVEVLGPNVTSFEVGDEVYGENLRMAQWKNAGAYAQFVAVPQERLARKPPGLSFEQAAAVPASGFIALSAVRDDAQVSPGQKVLVNGAGGGVGIFAVQLARAYGAEVTAVDSAGKLDTLRSLGAAHVIDYREQDYTASGEQYDVIIDVAMSHGLRDVQRALTTNGVYVFIGHDHFGSTSGRWFGSLGRLLRQVLASARDRRLRVRFSSPAPDRLAVMTAHLESGEVVPIVDRTFPLDAVPEAMRYMAQENAIGKVVITV